MPEALTLPPGPRDFAHRLIAWQQAHGRHDLPWQADRDPYKVWLSEVMLQQTQVSVVANYYPRFLQRFPTLRQLADAELDDVLAAWSGLGYYRRARHLHRAAQQLRDLHGGEFPREQAGLMELAGVGRSTAAAVAAFCFGQRAAILDGNVKRVLGRAFALEPATSDAAQLKALWQLAEALLPQRDVESYTQGLMDLGATLCKPQRPDCAVCPFAADCASRLRDHAAPAPSRRTPARAARPSQHWLLLWARCGDRVWLQQRDGHGIWPGLWSLPRCDDRQQALQLAAALGAVADSRELPAQRHQLTHVELLLQPVQVELHESGDAAAETAGAWFTLEQALALGLPAPIRRLLART